MTASDLRPVLVTGTTGFIGAALARELRSRGIAFRHAVRAAIDAPEPAVVVGDMTASTEWSEALRGVRAVIHLAGRAHVSGRGEAHRARLFETNERALATLADAARREGVRHFVLLSSTKVHGDVSAPSGFRETDKLRPADAYGASKLAGERALQASGLPYTIIRTPLVYGPGVKANFRALLRAVDRGIPLPLGSIRDNRRSLISTDNLVDVLIRVIEHPAAMGETFLVSDGEAVSTRTLVERIAGALGRRARLIPVPVALLRVGGTLTGRKESVMRLTESASVDDSKIAERLGWKPPFTMADGLRETVKWYRSL